MFDSFFESCYNYLTSTDKKTEIFETRAFGDTTLIDNCLRRIAELEHESNSKNSTELYELQDAMDQLLKATCCKQTYEYLLKYGLIVTPILTILEFFGGMSAFIFGIISKCTTDNKFTQDFSLGLGTTLIIGSAIKITITGILAKYLATGSPTAQKASKFIHCANLSKPIRKNFYEVCEKYNIEGKQPLIMEIVEKATPSYQSINQ